MVIMISIFVNNNNNKFIIICLFSRQFFHGTLARAGVIKSCILPKREIR